MTAARVAIVRVAVAAVGAAGRRRRGRAAGGAAAAAVAGASGGSRRSGARSAGGRGGAAVAAAGRARRAGRSPGVVDGPGGRGRRRRPGTGSAPAWPRQSGASGGGVGRRAAPAWRPALRARPPASAPGLAGAGGAAWRPGWPRLAAGAGGRPRRGGRRAGRGGAGGSGAGRGGRRRRVACWAAARAAPPGGCGRGRARSAARRGRRARRWAACVGDALLELRRALGRPAGPLAQALDLARLGEVEQREHRERRGRRRSRRRRRYFSISSRPRGRTRAEHERDESRATPVTPVGALGGRSDSSATLRGAAPAASPSSTSRLISSNVRSTHRGSSGSRSAQQDLLRRRRLRALVGVEQLLVQLLARRGGRRPRSRCRVSGSRPESADHVAREVDDPHRLAHLEHEDLAARRPASPTRMISCTASGIVMK